MSSASVEAVREQTLERLGQPTIRIGDKDVHVGALNLDQMAALTQFMSKVIEGLNEDEVKPLVAEVKRQTAPVPAKVKGRKGKGDDEPEPENPDTRMANMMTWVRLALRLLTPEQLGEFFSILTEEPAEWCRKKVTLPVIPKIISAIRDGNEPQVLLAAFREAVQGWSPQSNEPSGPGSSS